MKPFLTILSLFFFCGSLFSQSEALARQYFQDGNFKKAVVYYQKLHNENPANILNLQGLVTCYQQLETYEEAEKLLLNLINSEYYTPVLLVEIGYNYFLQGKQAEANRYFEKALQVVIENPAMAYSIGAHLKQKSVLNYAIKVYEKAMELNPSLNFNYDLALIYGEQGDIENMYNTYLNLIAFKDSYRPNVQRNLGMFISEEPTAENNLLLKKILLKKSQTEPNPLWNEMLSWLFIQQKQFNSAFVQEKAILKRTDNLSVDRMVDLGYEAKQAGDFKIAKEVFAFLNETFKDRALNLLASENLLEMEVAEASPETLAKTAENFEKALKEFGNNTETLNLQISYANFLAFQQNNAQKSLALLNSALQLPLSKYEEAKIKMAMADILVFDEKHNQAILYYAQIQKMVKNDVLSQTARFKEAQTSFYKGDFKWAEDQLKVLKSSTSQLIANDALQLKLLISDNTLQDSTHAALKLYAKAHLLGYQNKTQEAIAILDTLLVKHRSESIEDEALLMQAKLFEKQKQFEKAAENYQKIISFFSSDILVDDALFHLAELYANQLALPEKAKEFYERIIFNHADSIFFVEARKKFRKLRGDAIN